MHLIFFVAKIRWNPYYTIVSVIHHFMIFVMCEWNFARESQNFACDRRTRF